MAYQDIASANAILNHEITATRNFFAGVGAKFTSVLNAMAMASAGQRRAEKVEALWSKSDAELAQMGLKRENIVYHVFGDLFYV